MSCLYRNPVSASLVATAENRRHDTRTTAAMNYRHNPQGLFLGRVNDDIFAHHLKSKRAGGKIWALIALIGK